jgi:hypothetical protein
VIECGMIQFKSTSVRLFRLTAVALLGGLGTACVESRPVYDSRGDGIAGQPRWFAPSERCHDAPHTTADKAVFAGRISVSPGGRCSVEQKPALHSGHTLVGYEVLSEPRAGMLLRTSPTEYTYVGPRSLGTDSFVVRMRYSDRAGRIREPEIRYQVRIVAR